jgi:spermidine/putrescine transport system ATP-binding protein
MNASATDYAVELRNVVKKFADVPAVDHVSFGIRKNEFFSMLGPSGCGKTTTLRMIAGFEQPTFGDVLIFDKSVAGVPAFQRNVNTVFQSYALFPHMTVEQNVSFGLEMKRVPRDEIKKRVSEALDLVRLPHLAQRYPKQMSGGQQQRVALARALVNQPQVLLLDEPLGALDQKLRKEMQIELKQMQSRLGITFIFVTHDQEEALTMSDRICVMDKGKALQIGSPLEIYERPNCQFVADFIGETNFLHGKVTQISGEYATLTTNANMPFVGRAGEGISIGATAVLSVRPEKIQLHDEAKVNSGAFDVNGLNTYETRIGTVSYVGSDTRVIIYLGDERIDVWDENNFSTLDPNYYFRPGERAWLTFPPDNALILAK